VIRGSLRPGSGEPGYPSRSPSGRLAWASATAPGKHARNTALRVEMFGAALRTRCSCIRTLASAPTIASLAAACPAPPTNTRGRAGELSSHRAAAARARKVAQLERGTRAGAGRPLFASERERSDFCVFRRFVTLITRLADRSTSCAEAGWTRGISQLFGPNSVTRERGGPESVASCPTTGASS